MTRNFSLARITTTLLISCMCLLTAGYNPLVAQEASSELVIPEDAASISKGEALFKGNCTSCHRVHKKLVGPALANVYERTPSIEWIIGFVKNSQKVIQSGDEYAVNLYAEYNNTQMTAFTGFSDQDIMSILGYIQQETLKGPEVASGGSAENAKEDGGEATGVASGYLTVLMVGLVVVLALILFVLILIITVLKKYLNQRGLDEDDAEVVNATLSLEGIAKSKPFIFMVIFIFSAVAFKTVIAGLYTVGVQEGYQPSQPINFSHKIHAGQYEIDCQYCHTGVRKSKSANIPSANICMNCHSAVKTGSKEIQKIYAAIDYDPATKTYGPNQKPIEWVRIHNLPDLAYFNHSQHVKVGGIECETCHGEIKEMAVVQQYSPLTMGWCIDCHRKTNVNTKGNAYYDNLVEIHDKNSGGEPMKVEDIGGLECSKCHY